MHRKVWLLLVVLVAVPTTALAAPPSPLDGPVGWIGPAPVVQLPIGDTTIPDLFLLIGRGSHVPLGIEPSTHPLPPPLFVDPAAPPTYVRFDNMTVREAFDTLVKLDPRYRWRDLDGVAVLRPLTSWGDPHHFLNRSIGTVEYDKTSPEAMMDRVLGWLYGRPPRFGRETSGDSFPLEIHEGTVLMALVATAKADGDLYWWIQRPGAPGLLPASRMFRLWFGGLDRRWREMIIGPGMPPPWNGTTGGGIKN